MSELGTITEFTESLESDFFLARKGTQDIKISKSNLLKAVYPVGTVRYFTTISDPNQFLPGTWTQVLEDDCVIAAVENTDPNAGAVTGSNTVSIPLVSHTHSIKYVSPEGGHTHNITAVVSEDSDEFSGASGGAYSDPSFEPLATTSTEPDHDHSVYVNNSGVSNASIDALQRSMGVYTWVRVL
jgi:hypothetical protein